MENKILNIIDVCSLLKISDIEAKKLMKMLGAKKISSRYFITYNMLTNYLESNEYVKEDNSFIPPNL
jgi:hypothetical protein